MKSLLLLLALVAAGPASAQHSQRRLDSLRSQLRDRVERRYPQMPNAFAPRRTPGAGLALDSFSTQPYLRLQAPPGVHRLPQDGMPCLVPDTRGIAAMPNAAPLKEVPFPTHIPNAYGNRDKQTEKR